MKKLLKYFLGFVLLLIVIFVALGFIFPSVEYTTTVEINRPVEKTWPVFRERKDWIDGFQSVEQLSGRPEEVGNKARISVIRDGRESVFVSELKEIEPLQKVVSTLDNEYLTHDATVRFIAENGHTKVVSDERITGKGFFMRSLFPLFKGRFTEISKKNFEGLKQIVESAP